MARKKKDPEAIDIVFTEDARDMVVHYKAAQPEVLSRLAAARARKGEVKIALTFEELEEFVNIVEGLADETHDKRVQTELDEIAAYLQEIGTDYVMAEVGPFMDQPGGLTAALESFGRAFSENRPNDSAGEGETAPATTLTGLFDEMITKHGNDPCAEFGGLSLLQLMKLTEGSWDKPQGAVEVNEDLTPADVEGARIVRRIRDFLLTMAERGPVKATRDECLPAKFVTEVLKVWPTKAQALGSTRKSIKEQDAPAVLLVRILSEVSGLIALENGYFSLTEDGRNLMTEDKAGQLYVRLFTGYFQEINLGFFDDLPDLESFQALIAYPLYMFSRLATDWKTLEELAPNLLLPVVVADITSVEPEECFSLLVSRFFYPLLSFGLADLRDMNEDRAWVDPLEARKTPLLDKLMTFRI